VAEPASFHHYHLNVMDPDKTVAYYKQMFSAVPVKFRGASKALLIDRSFILMDKVDKPAPWEMISGIYHVGWGGIDGPSEFEWRDKLGMKWQTPLSSLGAEHYMYAYGPDNEVIEVWTGFRHERWGHVHMFTDDVKVATEWYVKHLGLAGGRVGPKPPKAPEGIDLSSGVGVFRYLWSSQVSTPNDVTINIFAKPSEDTINWWTDPPVGELVKSDGRVIDHLAFSYRDIDPVFERMKKDGVEIVEGIKENKEHKVRSFFVRGPDKVLIEIVEAKPLPEGVWED
jgi:catechol 2,3-dioxygenase-like lactoylglutathione lyase family enzyme